MDRREEKLVVNVVARCCRWFGDGSASQCKTCAVRTGSETVAQLIGLKIASLDRCRYAPSPALPSTIMELIVVSYPFLTVCGDVDGSCRYFCCCCCC